MGGRDLEDDGRFLIGEGRLHDKFGRECIAPGKVHAYFGETEL